jgi:hypothetical protein
VERGVLVLQDMVETRQGDILIGATPDEADALVDAMAILHARFWDASDADVASPALVG